ncbi:MAG: hypothetical protein Q7K26_00680 [bacterium]|nr:hypothetical protein [bacterium]
MPNGHGHKEYGKHTYSDGIQQCEHKCGCWMSDFSSGGPLGLDPFGTCPGNPVDGKLLGGRADYEHVVTDRIQSLESKLFLAEERLKKVTPSKIKLADKLESVQKELYRKNRLIGEFTRLIQADVIQTNV